MTYVPPPGFRVSGGPGLLVARSERYEGLVREGWTRHEVWDDHLARSARRSGRGSTARVEFEADLVMRIKKMRRGGLLEPLWRDRFAGAGRLLDNLRIPVEALARGVSTASPIALLVVPGPPGFFRAWIAFEELVGAIDLTAATRSAEPPRDDELRIAMEAVRKMHDAGVEHRDLNLGNLMIRRSEAVTRAFVIDLDRARLHSGGLPYASRQQALRRLERSWVKETGRGDADWIYDGYAASDASLSERLRSGRRAGRFLTRLHRQGGRR